MEVLEAINKRRSIRSYKSDPIPREVMDQLLEALRSAPSAANKQPWKFVVVTDPALKDQLALDCNGQKSIAG